MPHGLLDAYALSASGYAFFILDHKPPFVLVLVFGAIWIICCVIQVTWIPSPKRSSTPTPASA